MPLVVLWSQLLSFWIDVMFALFTEKSQRAIELLSKARVVRAEPVSGNRTYNDAR